MLAVVCERCFEQLLVPDAWWVGGGRGAEALDGGEEIGRQNDGKYLDLGSLTSVPAGLAG